MSHFNTLLAGNDPAWNLAPFHEYECTGDDDEFVIDVDRTDEARELYEKDTAVLVIQRPDGTKTYAFDGGSYKDEFRPFHDEVERELKLPEGYVELRDEPAKDYQDLEDWARDWYGDIEVRDGRIFQHTNPNKKWDWWVEGGRWSGWLLLKNGQKANQAKVEDVDWEGMRAEAGRDAAATYDKANPGTWLTFEEVLAGVGGDRERARDVYHAQPALKAVWERIDSFFFDADELLVGRETYISRAEDRAIAPFAFVKDREWFQRGEMGWFGMSSDEMPQADWNTLCWQQIQNLPGDTLLTVVDCHI